MKRPWSLKSSGGRMRDQHSLAGCHLPVRAVLGAWEYLNALGDGPQARLNVLFRRVKNEKISC